MSLSVYKFASILTLCAGLLTAQESQWKDTGEYEIYEKITKETDPKKKLELFKQWKDKYPESSFKKARQESMVQEAQRAGDAASAKEAARDLLALESDSYVANYAICNLGFANQNPSEQDLTEIGNASKGLLASLGKTFAADKKPQGVSDDQWRSARSDSELIAYSCAAVVPSRKKDYLGAIAEYEKALAVYPDNAAMSQTIGSLYIQLKDPKKYPLAFYHYARAVQMTGPRQLPDAAKKQQQAYLERQFLRYRNDKTELANLYKVAMEKPTPAADFYIKSDYDIQMEQYKDLEKLKSENPQLFLWREVRTNLTGAEGEKMWENVKGALLPPADYAAKKFKGRLIASEPETKPTKLIIAVDDPNVGDVTLKMVTALPGKAEPGIDLEFSGVALERTTSPYMLTLEVDPADVTGWPVAIAPAKAKKPAAGAKRPAAKPKRAK